MLIIVIIVIVAIVIIVIRVLAYCRSSCSVIMSVMFDHLLSFCFDTAQTRWFIAGMKSQKLEIPSRSIFGPCWTYPSPGDCRSASGNSRNCRRRGKETPRGIFPLHEGGGRKTCFDFFAMGFSWTWDMVKQCEMVKSAKQRHGPPTIYIYIYLSSIVWEITCKKSPVQCVPAVVQLLVIRILIIYNQKKQWLLAFCLAHNSHQKASRQSIRLHAIEDSGLIAVGCEGSEIVWNELE